MTILFVTGIKLGMWRTTHDYSANLSAFLRSVIPVDPRHRLPLTSRKQATGISLAVYSQLAMAVTLVMTCWYLRLRELFIRVRERKSPVWILPNGIILVLSCRHPEYSRLRVSLHRSNAFVGAEVKMMACRSVTEAHALVTSLVHRRGLSPDLHSIQGRATTQEPSWFTMIELQVCAGTSSSSVFKAMTITATTKIRRSQRSLTRLARTAPSNPPAKLAS
jgi:hypothetical protein